VRRPAATCSLCPVLASLLHLFVQLSYRKRLSTCLSITLARSRHLAWPSTMPDRVVLPSSNWRSLHAKIAASVDGKKKRKRSEGVPATAAKAAAAPPAAPVEMSNVDCQESAGAFFALHSTVSYGVMERV